MATGTQTKTNNPFTSVLTLMELPRETALAAFHSTLQAQEASSKVVKGMVEIGFSTQETNTKLVKEYWGSLFNVQQELIKKSSELAGKMLSTIPTIE